MLDLYRRHGDSCPHRSEGRNWTRCRCPIWCAGDLDGRAIRRAVGTRDWARAARQLERWEKNPQSASIAVSLQRAVDSYLTDCRVRNLRGSTVESYSNILGQFVKWGKNASIDQVDVACLTDFRARRKVEASTSVKELEILRAFCRFAVDRGWLEKNWAAKLKRPRLTAPPTMPYEPEEVERILDAATRLEHGNTGLLEFTRDRARAACLVLLYSGLRISDLVKLERSTVDLQTGRMLLRVMKTGVPFYGKLKPIAVQALAALPETGPYFFWTGNGDLITAVKNMRRTIQRVLKVAKVQGHPHRFRDTFSVELLRQGEDIRTVQLLLGHSSIATTEKHYAPYVRSMQKIVDAATEKLSFGERPESQETPKNVYNISTGEKTA